MRILHLLSQTELTGAEVYASELIELQARDGHKVFVISDKLHVPVKARFLALNVSTNSFWKRMKNIWLLRSFLKKEKIDIIHCHSRGAVRHAYWARLWRPIGLTTTLHGEQHFSFSKKILNLYGEIIIAVCENIQTAMIQNFKTSFSVIRVIRNPIKAPPKNDSPKKKFTVAIAGRSSGPKGFNIEQLGVQFFEQWIKTHPNLKISIIASQPERFSEAFQKTISKINSRHPGAITLLGHIDNLREKLSEFELVIASGRIAIESLLTGTQTLAMGEFCTHGLITLDNYKEALQSNFGDIGIQKGNVDFLHVSSELMRFFSTDLLAKDLTQLADQAWTDFAAETIHQKIIEVYKGTIFKRKHPRWIPILMYHKIPDQELQSQHRIFVTKDNFKKHLTFFKKNGFETLTFQELLDYWDQKKPMSQFPRKPLMLTFDDGYKDNLLNAQPLLKEQQMKATIFLLADHSIIENSWDSSTGETPSALMTLQEKLRLDPSVFEIGSHGFHHLHLTHDRQIAPKEMLRSKVQLEKDFNRSILSFAYPFGSTDLDLAEKCFQMGYRFAVNTDQGGLHLADNPHYLFRVNIFPEETTFSLRKKTSSWYRKYFYKKRGK